MSTPKPPPARVPAELLDERTKQLVAEYRAAKDEADAATKRFETIRDSIKVALQVRAPEAHRIAVDGLDEPVSLDYRERVTVDSKRFKADAEADPAIAAIYVRYAKFGGAWYLKVGG